MLEQNKRYTFEEIQKRVTSNAPHQLWLESGGAEGRRLVLEAPLGEMAFIVADGFQTLSCDFRGVKFSRVTFVGDYCGADFRGVHFEGCELGSWEDPLMNATFEKAKFDDSTFESFDSDNSSFVGASFKRVKFKRGRFQRAKMEFADFTDLMIEGEEWQSVYFDECYVYGLNLAGVRPPGDGKLIFSYCTAARGEVEDVRDSAMSFDDNPSGWNVEGAKMTAVGFWGGGGDANARLRDKLNYGTIGTAV